MPITCSTKHFKLGKISPGKKPKVQGLRFRARRQGFREWHKPIQPTQTSNPAAELPGPKKVNLSIALGAYL